mmetsp:Transcript_6064/g.13545  ORF Transcript_6064/g.13545 Transcript_6064/m.13545 type:complete len:98 (+) Transcript_6064:71-364(+)
MDGHCTSISSHFLSPSSSNFYGFFIASTLRTERPNTRERRQRSPAPQMTRTIPVTAWKIIIFSTTQKIPITLTNGTNIKAITTGFCPSNHWEVFHGK